MLHFIGKKRSRVSWSGMRPLGLLSVFLQTLLWHGCTPQFTPLKQMGPLGGLWICSLSTSIASGISTTASHLLSKQDLFPLTQWERCWMLGMGSTPLKSERRTAILPPSSLKKVRFRYKRAAMGFLASQDAYTHRYDNIIADVERKTKCVDDTLLWDDRDDLGKHWWRIIDYLILTGSNGVILHPEPEKFQFSTMSVNFTGFHLSESAVQPLPKYLDAIATFPRPANIQDARSWFGLVTQVAHYGRLTDLMAPFRPLLSPKTAFDWTPELEAAFQHSRAAIVQQIRDGVEIFDPKLKTCLTPDWSKQGIGYWLRQKHCECDSVIPGCCPTGWRVTLAGSRFLRDAEQRYAPIEGEALAVAWALDNTKFFTLGCKDLVVATDHKPLVKILGDRCLGDIDNMCIFHSKQRTLKWRFQIVHIPGP